MKNKNLWADKNVFSFYNEMRSGIFSAQIVNVSAHKFITSIQLLYLGWVQPVNFLKSFEYPLPNRLSNWPGF
jgi:hypothetical protein